MKYSEIIFPWKNLTENDPQCHEIKGTEYFVETGTYIFMVVYEKLTSRHTFIRTVTVCMRRDHSRTYLPNIFLYACSKVVQRMKKL